MSANPPGQRKKRPIPYSQEANGSPPLELTAQILQEELLETNATYDVAVRSVMEYLGCKEQHVYNAAAIAAFARGRP